MFPVLGIAASMLTLYILQRGVRHLVFTVRERNRARFGETTTGVCVGHQWTRHGAVIGVVRYEDTGGRTREVLTGPGTRPPPKVGETALVTYNPGNPAHRGVVNGELGPVIADVLDVSRFFIGAGVAAGFSFVFLWAASSGV
ncbi:DUF3592 domain-containing protein [Streptomyces fenghuangensis]